MPENALRMADRLGVDMHAHQSVRIERSMLDRAGVVLVFDVYGYETLVRAGT